MFTVADASVCLRHDKKRRCLILNLLIEALCDLGALQLQPLCQRPQRWQQAHLLHDNWWGCCEERPPAYTQTLNIHTPNTHTPDTPCSLFKPIIQASKLPYGFCSFRMCLCVWWRCDMKSDFAEVTQQMTDMKNLRHWLGSSMVTTTWSPSPAQGKELFFNPSDWHDILNEFSCRHSQHWT